MMTEFKGVHLVMKEKGYRLCSAFLLDCSIFLFITQIFVFTQKGFQV